MYCEGCQKKHKSGNWKYTDGKWYCQEYFNPKRVEFVPEYIKDDRERNLKSIIQPYRRGELSKEYIDAWGPEKVTATDEEIRKAKNVWQDLPGIANVDKST